eukprot:815868-Pyramimonas_sp.AAC.1
MTDSEAGGRAPTTASDAPTLVMAPGSPKSPVPGTPGAEPTVAAPGSPGRSSAFSGRWIVDHGPDENVKDR